MWCGTWKLTLEWWPWWGPGKLRDSMSGESSLRNFALERFFSLISWETSSASLVMASCSTTSSAMFWITVEITDAKEREREREVTVLIESRGHSGIFISNTRKLKTHKFFLRGCNFKGQGNVSSFFILNIINKFAAYCYIRWERAGVGSKSRYLERDDMIILHIYLSIIRFDWGDVILFDVIYFFD